MNDRFFLDTNVFVYLFDHSSSRKAAISRKLLKLGIESRKGVVSYQVVQEFFNVAYKRFPQSFPVDQSADLLDTVLRPMWMVRPSPDLFLRAFRLLNRFHLQWYDALIVSAAIEAQCEILYSEDFQNRQTFDGVQVHNPFL